MDKHLLALEDLSREQLWTLLHRANEYRERLDRGEKDGRELAGWTVANMFFENSTRTRMSFELAAKYLGAHVINFSQQGSSLAKGESLLDTAQNIEAMAVDCMVIRHGTSGAVRFVAENTRASVVNAGEGRHEHPTQGLLDILTIWRHKQQVEGLKVVIVGDVLHSRVARSNIQGLTKLGAKVTVCAPATLLPDSGDWQVETETDLNAALDSADVVNVLRLQLERQQQGLFPSAKEYFKFWGVDQKHLQKDMLLLHPGPMNRGLEISHQAADGPNSVILDQVTNGVAVRMAVLSILKERGGN
ncbi:MAG: aspartate carbamoyltransferase catalytic subunit [Firmicutes bacterium]|nr:aspartate carbamoyltransferase catalytic subunit [Bacillota bacterium]